MMYGEVYVGERTMHGRLQDRHGESEARWLVRQSKAHSPNRLGTLGRRLLGRMSYRLMAVGARLVSFGLPAYLPVNRELNGNAPPRRPPEPGLALDSSASGWHSPGTTQR